MLYHKLSEKKTTYIKKLRISCGNLKVNKTRVVKLQKLPPLVL